MVIAVQKLFPNFRVDSACNAAIHKGSGAACLLPNLFLLYTVSALRAQTVYKKKLYPYINPS